MYQRILDRIRLFFQKEKEPFLRLYDILGFYPHDIEVYQTALMHKSMGGKLKEGRRINNERLEYLGDAVIEAVVSALLYEHFRNKQEGFLTTVRSRIVRRDTLNRLASQIGLDKLVLYNGSCCTSHNSYVNGNAFEALVGAIYLDRGYDYCMAFMRERILGRCLDLDKMAIQEVNFKSKIIEWCQKYQLSFSYEVVEEKMKDGENTPMFSSQIVIEGVVCGRGDGFSKKESHQNAARQALNRIHKDTSFVNALMSARTKRQKAEVAAVEVVESQCGA